MNAIPLVRAAALSPHLDAFSVLGAPREPLLEKVGLPPLGELRPDVLIPYQQAIDFVCASERALGPQTLPALAFQRANLEHLGSWGQILGRTKTLGEFFTTLTKGAWMHTTGARWWVGDAGPDVLLCHQFDRRLDLGQGEPLVLLLGFILGPIRRVLGADFVPSEITVVQPLPMPLDRLGVPLHARVTGLTSIRMPRRLLSTPTPHLKRLVADDGDHAAALTETSPSAQFVASVRQALRPLCAASRIDLESFSEIVRIAPRTLQRRLGDCGTTFRSVVDEAQLARAIDRMSDPAVKLIDVAFDLGFSDPAHFTRAFRRWTGVSPRTFRRVHLGN